MLVKEMSDIHRKCYRVLKCLKDDMEADADIPSYIFTVAVLHHSKRCTYSGTTNIADCIQDIV
jgi:hypothetical protein